MITLGNPGITLFAQQAGEWAVNQLHQDLLALSLAVGMIRKKPGCVEWIPGLCSATVGENDPGGPGPRDRRIVLVLVLVVVLALDTGNRIENEDEDRPDSLRGRD